MSTSPICPVVGPPPDHIEREDSRPETNTVIIIMLVVASIFAVLCTIVIGLKSWPESR